jgi:hypothetical protein
MNFNRSLWKHAPQSFLVYVCLESVERVTKCAGRVPDNNLALSQEHFDGVRPLGADQPALEVY